PPGRARHTTGRHAALLLGPRRIQDAARNDLAPSARREPVQVDTRPAVPAILEARPDAVLPAPELGRAEGHLRCAVASVVEDQPIVDPEASATLTIDLETIQTARRHVEDALPLRRPRVPRVDVQAAKRVRVKVVRDDGINQLLTWSA